MSRCFALGMSGRKNDNFVNINSKWGRVKKTIRTQIVVVLVVVFVIGIGVLSFRALRTELKTARAERGEIVEAIYGLGRVKPRREYEIKVSVVSTAQAVFVREGDSVIAGTPLLKLADSGVFKAPFPGVVSLISINEGEPTTPNVPLLRVEDHKDRYIEVSLEQQGALRVQKGQPAEVVFESVRGEKLTGKVEALFSRSDEFLAHIEVLGLKPNILPGMTADVAIVVARHSDALLIPVSAVNNGYVTLLLNGKRTKKQVRLGGIDGQMAEVVEGDIKEGDEIVLGKAK